MAQKIDGVSTSHHELLALMRFGWKLVRNYKGWHLVSKPHHNFFDDEDGPVRRQVLWVPMGQIDQIGKVSGFIKWFPFHAELGDFP